MFTPTAPLGRALRRLALTTKQAGKDYYKGTGSGSMGSHTKWGGYKIDWSKVRTYVVPDLTDFPVCAHWNRHSFWSYADSTPAHALRRRKHRQARRPLRQKRLAHVWKEIPPGMEG